MNAAPTGAPAAALRELAQEPFVSLTTFRRSGAGVATPVWVGWDRDALVVSTPRGSGKVKRLRRSSAVELQACSRTGRVAAGAATVSGTAELLTDPETRTRVSRVLRRKYRVEYLLVMAIERLASPRGHDRVALRITPAAPSPR